MLNWSQTLMQSAGAAGVAFIGADYLVPVLLPPQWRSPHASLALACATMLILLTFNYCGVKPGARLQNLLSLLEDASDYRAYGVALLLAPQARVAPAVAAAPTGLRLASALILVLLRLRRLSIDHEPGRRPEGRAPAISSGDYRRHADRGRPLFYC